MPQLGRSIEMASETSSPALLHIDSTAGLSPKRRSIANLAMRVLRQQSLMPSKDSRRISCLITMNWAAATRTSAVSHVDSVVIRSRKSASGEVFISSHILSLCDWFGQPFSLQKLRTYIASSTK